jgi:hypothetical protein
MAFDPAPLLVRQCASAQGAPPEPPLNQKLKSDEIPECRQRLERTAPQRTESGVVGPATLNSPIFTTLDNNEIFLPSDKTENGLCREIGWPNRSGIQPSPLLSY